METTFGRRLCHFLQVQPFDESAYRTLLFRILSTSSDS